MKYQVEHSAEDPRYVRIEGEHEGIAFACRSMASPDNTEWLDEAARIAWQAAKDVRDTL